MVLVSHLWPQSDYRSAQLSQAVGCVVLLVGGTATGVFVFCSQAREGDVESIGYGPPSLGDTVDTESDEHQGDPCAAELRQATLMNDSRYVAALVKLQEERAVIEGWLAKKRVHANSVNIQEALDLGIEVLERSFVKGTPFGVMVAESGFPYKRMKEKLFRVALTALDRLSKPRRAFRTNTTSPVTVGGTRQDDARTPSFVDGADLVDELTDAMESELEYSATNLSNADAEDAHEGMSTVTAFSATQDSRRDDPVFQAVARAELLLRLDAALQELKSGQPDAYRMLRIRLAYETAGASCGFFTYLGQVLDCNEAAARQRWQRYIRKADSPVRQAFNNIWSQFTEMEIEGSLEEALYGNQ